MIRHEFYSLIVVARGSKMKGHHLLFFYVKAAAAVLLSLLSFESAGEKGTLAAELAAGPHDNDEAWDRNKESSFFPQSQRGALPSLSPWPGREKEEGSPDEGVGAVASSPVDESQQLLYDSHHDIIQGALLSDKAQKAVELDWQSRMDSSLLEIGEGVKQKGTSKPSRRYHRWRGRSPSSFSLTADLLNRPPAGNTRGFRRFRFLAAVASSLALVILVQQPSGGQRSSYLGSLLSKRRKSEDGAGEDKNSVDKDVVSDGGKFISVSLGDGKPLVLQPSFLILIFFFSLLVAMSSVTWALPVRRRNEQEREEQQGLSEEVVGDDESGPGVLSWMTGGNIRAHQLPREKLMAMRRAAGLLPGEYTPRVDYEQRSDGSLHILVGRAWKKSPDGPWADGEACIRFNYLGHRFRVYLPKSAEELLTKAGVLKEFVDTMSEPPTTMALLSGRYTGDGHKKFRGVHWGPLTGNPLWIAFGENGVQNVISIPWTVSSILKNSYGAFMEMETVLLLTSLVWEEMREQAPALKPALLKTADKAEL